MNGSFLGCLCNFLKIHWQFQLAPVNLCDSQSSICWTRRAAASRPAIGIPVPVKVAFGQLI